MLDNELTQFAKLLAWPELQKNYSEFRHYLTAGFVNSELQALHEVWQSLENTPENVTETIETITEETILRSPNGKTIRLSTGNRIKINVKELVRTAKLLSDTAEAFRTFETNQKVEEEFKLRQYLERTIVQVGVGEEPSFLTKSDPLSTALSHITQLKEKACAFSLDASDFDLPLQNYALSTAPKRETAIDTFDNLELGGGTEEDSTMILCGETNIGKSHLGLFCLSSLCLRRHAVMLCSGEDSLETTRKRWFAHFLRRERDDIMKMTEMERLHAFRELYGHEEDTDSLHHHIRTGFPIACIREGEFSPQKMEEKIDAYEQKHQKKIVMFMGDYLQKMIENPAKRYTKRQRDEEMEFIVNQVREMCQKRKTSSLLISQVPSHAAGGGHEFLNLKQAVARSYAATWGAHYVITLNRTTEEIRRLATARDKRPRLNMFLCKNKDGPLGVCYTLGYPKEARWEFFRTKVELENRVESTLSTRTNLENEPFQRP